MQLIRPLVHWHLTLEKSVSIEKVRGYQYLHLAEDDFIGWSEEILTTISKVKRISTFTFVSECSHLHSVVTCFPNINVNKLCQM